MPQTAAYLYCVVHCVRPPSLARLPPGVPGSGPLVAAAAGRALWTIGGEVPLAEYGSEPVDRTLRDLDRVARIALAHESVVASLFRQRGTTVVPMKLFTLFSTMERAVAETAAASKAIRAIVRRIAGCEEWGVRIVRAASAAPAASAAARPPSGAAFLAARRDARDAARAAARESASGAEDAFRELSRLARRSRRREEAPPAGGTPLLLDAAFLVPSDRRARFRAAVRRLADAQAERGSLLTLTGPWAAHSFVQAEDA